MDRPKKRNLRWRSPLTWTSTIVLAIVLTAAHAPGLSADDSPFPPLAPEFTLPNLDGTQISLSDYSGSIVILDFWASWCGPCTETLPEIHALEEAYADRGVVLLLLCFDKCEEDARAYLTEHDYATDNVLWGSLKQVRAVRDLFGVEAVTHTLVIDTEGYIRYSGHPAKLTSEVLEPWLLEKEEPEIDITV